MMRWALFEKSGVSLAVALEKVLHVLTAPQVFELPLLKRVFTGGIIYQGQVVPLLVGASDPGQQEAAAFVIVCEAEFGLIGLPADRIIEITKTDNVTPGGDATELSGSEDNENISCDYRHLDLNAILEDPEFSMCGLKD
jgi:chemotaxis signal transduction protein